MSKYVDLKRFRKDNDLTQTVVGEYLGIGKSFISRIESGEVGLPEEKLIKLLNNDKGWDITSLLANSTINQKGINNVVGSGNKIMDTSEHDELIKLRVENEMLKLQLNEKERLIQILMNK